MTPEVQPVEKYVQRQINGIVHGGDPEGSDNRELCAWFALRAVLELPRWDVNPVANQDNVDGYNQALSDVSQKITEALGVTE